MPPQLELDTTASHWQWALDAEERALGSSGSLLRPLMVASERHALARERLDTARLLSNLARARGIAPAPWLPPTRVSTHMLGLPAGTEACVVDLDGVLTDSGVVHAAAWSDALDPFLLDIAQSTGRAFVPFDRDAEYRRYFDGRDRRAGIRLFLASRGIQGHVDELARRKGDALERLLRSRGISALPGSRRYLQALSYARIHTAVVSASTATLPMLRLAQLEHLVTREILVGVDPQHVVRLTHSVAGVVEAQRAGMTAIGVGPQLAVASLASLLAPALRTTA